VTEEKWRELRAGYIDVYPPGYREQGEQRHLRRMYILRMIQERERKEEKQKDKRGKVVGVARVINTVATLIRVFSSGDDRELKKEGGEKEQRLLNAILSFKSYVEAGRIKAEVETKVDGWRFVLHTVRCEILHNHTRPQRRC